MDTVAPISCETRVTLLWVSRNCLWPYNTRNVNDFSWYVKCSDSYKHQLFLLPMVHAITMKEYVLEEKAYQKIYFGQNLIGWLLG